MNLTLKQLFKFGAVCMGVCALSVSATDFVSDSFEALGGGSDGLAIGEYKQVYVGPTETITNWFQISSDASKLVPVNAAYAAVSANGPITNATKALMLNLETEGNTLSRLVTGASAASVPVYIDTLIQFTPSEDEPASIGADTKIALYVNAESNLVVVSKKYTDPENDDFTPVLTNSVIALGTPIDPEKWYRLTMKIVRDDLDCLTEIWIDGTIVTHPNAYDITNVKNGGSAFLNIDNSQPVINFISFQGTGALDELVVTDVAPSTTSSAIMLTLAYSGPGTVTFQTGSFAGPFVTKVASGTTVYMLSSDWYQMGAATSPEASFTNSAPITEDQVIDHDTTFSANVACTVTVETALLAGDFNIGGSRYIDLSTLAGWALGNGYSFASVSTDTTGAYLDAYMLGVSTGVAATAKLVITSIVVDEVADTTTVTVEVENGEDNIAYASLNGVVTVWTTDDLAVDFAPLYSADVTGVADTATVVIDGVVTDQFIQAKVEIIPTLP